MWEKRDFLGTGVKFPPQIDLATGRFKTVKYEQDIKEAIYIILMTSKGERAMLPEFGCNLQDYVYELTNDTYLNLLKVEIINALQRWESRIEQIEVDIDRQEVGEGKILINIKYVVSSTNTKDNLVFPYFIESKEDEV